MCGNKIRKIGKTVVLGHKNYKLGKDYLLYNDRDVNLCGYDTPVIRSITQDDRNVILGYENIAKTLHSPDPGNAPRRGRAPGDKKDHKDHKAKDKMAWAGA